MATYSSVLAWRIPGTWEPGGLLYMGSPEVGHDWSDLASITLYHVVWSVACPVPVLYYTLHRRRLLHLIGAWSGPHTPALTQVHILFFSAILTHLLFLYQNMPSLASFWLLSLLRVECWLKYFNSGEPCSPSGLSTPLPFPEIGLWPPQFGSSCSSEPPGAHTSVTVQFSLHLWAAGG